MPKVKLGDIAKERREVYKGDKSSCPVVGLEHLVPGEIRLSAWNVGGDNTFSKAFFAGDVLFGRRRAYLKKAAQATVDGVCSGDITVIQARADRVSPDLLPFIIQNDAFFEFAVKNSAGSLSPRVKWEHLANYEINLSPMNEQRNLADLLWAAYDLKESYQRLLNASDEMAKSRFIEMFGDPVENPMQWPKARFIDAVADDCKLSYGIVKTGDNQTNGVPVFRPVDFTDGKIPKREDLKMTTAAISNAYKRTVLKGRELLITIRGSVGETFIAGPEFRGCNVARNIVPIRVDEHKITLFFLQELLRTNSIQEIIRTMTKGVALQGINVEEMREINLILPPLPIQNEFVAFVRHLDKSKVELLRCIADTDSMIKGLQNQMHRG